MISAVIFSHEHTDIHVYSVLIVLLSIIQQPTKYRACMILLWRKIVRSTVAELRSYTALLMLVETSSLCSVWSDSSCGPCLIPACWARRDL